jgi:hypothetical protein
MTRQDVEGLLGRPTWLYLVPDAALQETSLSWDDVEEGFCQLPGFGEGVVIACGRWNRNGKVITVHYEGGRVIRKSKTFRPLVDYWDLALHRIGLRDGLVNVPDPPAELVRSLPYVTLTGGRDRQSR